MEQTVVQMLGPELEKPGCRDITFSELRYIVEVPNGCADDLFDTEMIVRSVDEVDVKALQEQVEADRVIEQALRAHRDLRKEPAKPRERTSSKASGKDADKRLKKGMRSRRRRLDTCFMRSGERVELDEEAASSETGSSKSDDEDAREWVAAHSASAKEDQDEARRTAARELPAFQDVPKYPDLKLYKPPLSNTVVVLKKPETELVWAAVISFRSIDKLCVAKLAYQIGPDEITPKSVHMHCKMHRKCSLWKVMKDVPCQGAMLAWVMEGSMTDSAEAHKGRWQHVASKF